MMRKPSEILGDHRAKLERAFLLARARDRQSRAANARGVASLIALEAERLADEARIRAAIDDVILALSELED
jgi:hypothetical protein